MKKTKKTKLNLGMKLKLEIATCWNCVSLRFCILLYFISSNESNVPAGHIAFSSSVSQFFFFIHFFSVKSISLHSPSLLKLILWVLFNALSLLFPLILLRLSFPLCLSLSLSFPPSCCPQCEIWEPKTAAAVLQVPLCSLIN